MKIEDDIEVLRSKIADLEDSNKKITTNLQKCESIFNNIKEVIFQTDAGGLWTYLNRPWEEITGFSLAESLGNLFFNFVHPEDRSLNQQLFESLVRREKEYCRHTIRYLVKDGGFRWIEVFARLTLDENNNIIGTSGTLNDVHERILMEHELKISRDHLEEVLKNISSIDSINLVGQLAAGIAHEIRNPMTTVRCYLQLLGSRPEHEAKRSTFDLMISELDRANAIITEYLSLAQKKPAELKSQNLNEILNRLYPLIEAETLTRDKQIYFIAGDIPDLELNGKEISQLILNLAHNGLEAMEGIGSLTIQSYVEDGKVVLEIADEGCGIPPEHISMVGTPFFTTKDTGTGLGLTSCYKIAKAHNAQIHIESSPNGSKFFIRFPIPDNEQNEEIS